MKPLGIALAASLVVGCAEAPGPTPLLLDAQPTTVSEQSGEYYGITWIDDHLVVGYEPNPDSTQGLPYTLPLGGGRMEPLGLPQRPTCQKEQLLTPTRAVTGELLLASLCQVRVKAESDPPSDERRIVIADLASGITRDLVSTPDTPDQIALAADFTGAISAGSPICQGILRVGPSAVTTFDAEVKGHGQRFNLADEFDPEAVDCDATGRADFPALGPGTNELVFMASPASVGLSGQARLDEPWGIYRMHEEGRTELLLDDVGNARGLAWSPDGEWLAFGGDVAGFGDGVWAYQPAAGRLIRVSDQPIEGLAWAPNGLELAAITNDGNLAWPPVREVVRWDLSVLSAVSSD